MEFSMIILAGGRSSRMGRDKCDLLLGDRTFLELQIEKGRALGIKDILISGYRGTRCELPVVPDRFSEKGPLGGLEACLRRVRNEKALVLTVDVPMVPVEALSGLLEKAAECSGPVILKHGERFEPMMSVLPAEMAKAMPEEIERGRGRLFNLLDRWGFETYESHLPEGLFQNVNDPETYEKLKENICR